MPRMGSVPSNTVHSGYLIEDGLLVSTLILCLQNGGTRGEYPSVLWPVNSAGPAPRLPFHAEDGQCSWCMVDIKMKRDRSMPTISDMLFLSTLSLVYVFRRPCNRAAIPRMGSGYSIQTFRRPCSRPLLLSPVAVPWFRTLLVVPQVPPALHPGCHAIPCRGWAVFHSARWIPN